MASNKDTQEESGFYGKEANVDAPHHEKLQRFYTPRPVEVTRADYDDWAQEYDKDTAQSSGYCAPQEVAKLIAQQASSPDQKVVDLGCGTGQLGAELAKLGHRNVEGWDLSPGMLKVAAATGAYQGLHEIDLTKSLPFQPGSQELMASVGVYGPGVVGPEHLELLVAPLCVGGLSVHSINGLSWRKRPFGQALQALVDDGQVKVLHQHWAPYIRNENIDGLYIVLQKY